MTTSNGYCELVGKQEEEQWRKYCIMEGTVNTFIHNVGSYVDKEERFHVVENEESNEQSVW
jgi:hypothetical protein